MLENTILPVERTVAAADLPGFGMRVKPDVWAHPKAVIRTGVA